MFHSKGYQRDLMASNIMLQIENYNQFGMINP